MQTFELDQIQAAQDHRPQVERFITASAIYVIESMADYDSVPPEVQAAIDLRNEFG
jgi:hypothetical protein